MSDFLKQLAEKLKTAGLPLAEHDAEILYKVLSEHLKTFKSGNNLIDSLLPVLLIALDKVALDAINKIDGQPG